MSASRFVYGKEEIWTASRQCTELSNDLSSILTRARNLKSKIESYDGWEGKQKEELLGFLELIILYHTDLTSAVGNPFSTMIVAMNELIQNIEGLPENSDAYGRLNKK